MCANVSSKSSIVLSISRIFTASLLALTLVNTGCSKKTESTETTTTDSAAPHSSGGGGAASAAATAVADATSAQASNDNVQQQEQLGTKWGDEVSSLTAQVDAKRLTSQPIEELQVRYADKDFKGKSLNDISLQAGQLRFTVQTDAGERLPLYRAGQNYYVAGKAGQSYQLHYQNNSDNTYEIVASVDGIDVLNGSSASRSNAGYIVKPHETLVIEGFRKSAEAVASFTFSKPEASYANHNASGSVSNAGIIGTAIYELEPLEPKPAPQYAPEPTAKPNAFPSDGK